jgi:hypothetical protein
MAPEVSRSDSALGGACLSCWLKPKAADAGPRGRDDFHLRLAHLFLHRFVAAFKSSQLLLYQFEKAAANGRLAFQLIIPK